MRLPSLEEMAIAVKRVSEIAVRRFGQPVESNLKEDNTPVTQVDLAIDQALADWARAYPKVGYVSEESVGNTDNCQYIIYTDPLDGTGAYRRGLATATIVTTLMEKVEDNLWCPLRAVIYNPITRQLWLAEHYGQTKVSRTLEGYTYRREGKVAKARAPHEVTAVAWKNAPHKMESIKALLLGNPQVSHQSYGSTALGAGLIASGTMDAVLTGSYSAVEVAAMMLIVRGAGGEANDLFGYGLSNFELRETRGKLDFYLPRGAIMSSNQALTEELVKVVEQANSVP